MLLIFPIILCSNSRRYHLLCFAFLLVMLESMTIMDLSILTQFGGAWALQSIQ